MTALRVQAVRVQPYRLPFQQPFTTSHGLIRAREGIIITVVLSDGTLGWGESVVDPDFGTASLIATTRRAEALATTLRSATLPAARATLRPTVVGDGAAQAVTAALVDAEARAAGVPLYQWLAERQGWHAAPPASIAVNATISAAGRDDAVTAAQAAVVAGFGCIKLKVGLLVNDDAELGRIAAVRAAVGPGCHLRLDANEGWDAARAATLIPQLTDLDIQYLEQPVPRHQLAALRQLRGLGVPIAADESLLVADPAAVAQLADILILKPTVLGLERCLALAETAQHHGQTVVITGSLEAGIGVAGALHLAAALPEMALECGLATLDLLHDDLIVEKLAVQGGYMSLPAGNGLGVTLDDVALARYAADLG